VWLQMKEVTTFWGVDNSSETVAVNHLEAVAVFPQRLNFELALLIFQS